MTEQNAIALRPETDLAETMSLGSVFAKSGYFQDARDAAQAVVKVLAGREVGLPPIASMTGIHIVKGKIGFAATTMGALIKRSGKYDYRVVEHTDKACEIHFYQQSEKLGSSRFTLADATLAGLAGGDNWRHYPRNMLYARAMSNGAKWFCSEIFGGPVYTPDELVEIKGAPPEALDVSAQRVEQRGEDAAPAGNGGTNGGELPPTKPSYEPFGAVTMAMGIAKGEGGDVTMSVVLERYFGPGIRTKGRLDTLANELPDFYREKYEALHREYDAVKAGL